MRTTPIETERLYLRGFTKDDALWAYHIWNDPEMGRYLPDEAKEDVDPEYLKVLEVLGDDDECTYLIPVLKGSGERVGTCSYMVSADGKTYDIAYCIHKDFWNRGFATEAALGMIDRARQSGAKRVTIAVSRDNAPSNCVAQKCGGRVVSKRDYLKKGTDVRMTEYIYEVEL